MECWSRGRLAAARLHIDAGLLARFLASGFIQMGKTLVLKREKAVSSVSLTICRLRRRCSQYLGNLVSPERRQRAVEACRRRSGLYERQARRIFVSTATTKIVRCDK